MDDRGKSDDPVVPARPPNKAQGGAAEAVEERGSPKGNAAAATRPGPRAGHGVPSALDRVRRAARRDKDARFTALLHHVDQDRLRAAYWALEPKAAPGVDEVTWQDYGQDLEANLRDLHARVHRGGYPARPSRRVFIPKPDGRRRPLGIAALEDKVVQRALVEVLNAIYEEDFLGFSYGFRPGRKPHDALDALATGILRRRVNWVLDADLREYFSSLDHRWPSCPMGAGREACVETSRRTSAIRRRPVCGPSRRLRRRGSRGVPSLCRGAGCRRAGSRGRRRRYQ
jgi:RNA-directed DNA polymerase